jgi:hypothetical protein
MKKSITQKYLINGPNNVIRLTNGEKVIYIFGEYHNNLYEQSECSFNEKHKSLDIDKFLLNFFTKEKIIEFDLFIETHKDWLIYYKTADSYRLPYIKQIRKIVGNKYDIKDNEIIISKNFPNFRFHYFDFRLSISESVKELNFNYFHNFNTTIYPYPYNYLSLYNIYQDLKVLIDNLNLLLKFLSLEKTECNYIDKIKNNYKNKEIKKKINFIYDNHTIKCIEYNINLSNKILDYIDLHKIENLGISIEIKIEEKLKLQQVILLDLFLLRCNISHLFCTLVDLYLLRRILDKQYTKNNIIYCGMHHLTNISIFLVKYFNFKITNIYFNNNLDFNKEIIKIKINDYCEYSHLTYLLSNKKLDEHMVADQCVNLFDFPPNFT